MLVTSSLHLSWKKSFVNWFKPLQGYLLNLCTPITISQWDWIKMPWLLGSYHPQFWNGSPQQIFRLMIGFDFSLAEPSFSPMWKGYNIFVVNYIYIYIYIMYIRFIYLMPWKLSNIYIYLLLFHNSSISDIEHSPNYIAIGSPQTHKLN